MEPTTEQWLGIVGGLSITVGLLVRHVVTLKKRNGNGHSKPESELDLESMLKEAAALGAINATVDGAKERLEAGFEEIKALRHRADGFQDTIRKTRLDEQ